jgi:acetyl esterase
MVLDAQVQLWLKQLADAQVPPLEKLTVEEARRQMEETAASLETGEAVWQITETQLAGPAGPLRVRVYDPGVHQPSPAMIFFHGGGWVIGSIESHDCLCRCLANATGIKILSVAYRLAPEHRYPAAAEDAYAAVVGTVERAVSLGVEADRLVVCGDSAGGNLAAVTALMVRDRGGPALRAQILLYPVLDHNFDTDSYLRFLDGYFLTRDAMMWFWDHYVPEIERRCEPYASPLRAADLTGLPPTLIVAAECDPLRDEAAAYARRLQAAGNRVKYVCYPGMIHGFLRRTKFWDVARKGLHDVARAVRQFVGLEPPGPETVGPDQEPRDQRY